VCGGQHLESVLFLFRQIDSEEVKMVNSQLVPTGLIPVFGYVPIEKVRIASPGPLHMPAVIKWHKIISAASATTSGPGAPQPFDAPFGYWNNDNSEFILTDGRHRFAALQICGFLVILVRWMSDYCSEKKG
jgi:hypothetical protein